jgi:hypothetical protein
LAPKGINIEQARQAFVKTHPAYAHNVLFGTSGTKRSRHRTFPWPADIKDEAILSCNRLAGNRDHAKAKIPAAAGFGLIMTSPIMSIEIHFRNDDKVALPVEKPAK